MSRRNPASRSGVLLALVLSLASAATLRAAITGVVVDDNGAPLAGASVSAFAQETPAERATRIRAGKLDRTPLASATSAQDGTFRLEPARPVVELVASADGRGSFASDAADGDEALTIVLYKSKPRTGRVLADGKPVGGAAVVAGAITARTGADGTFTLPISDVFAPRVTVVHPDYAPEEVGYRAGRLEVSLSRGVTLRGRILAPDGRTPAAHVPVSTDIWTSAETAADGSFVLAHVARAWRGITARSAAGAAFAARSGVAAYELRLSPATSISGSVRIAGSRTAVAGMRVTLGSFGQIGGASDVAITDAKGTFGFTGLPPGRYNAGGTHPIYHLESSEGAVTVAAGDRKNETYAAVPLDRIQGSVVDEAKKPLPAAIVATTTGGDQARIAVTNAKGEFSIRVIPKRGAPLLVTKEGFLPAATPSSNVQGRSRVITLQRGFPLTVKVVDEEKQPVSGATVTFASARDSEEPGPRTMIRCGEGPCTTGSEGSVEVRIAPGNYTIHLGGESVVQKNLPAQKVDEKSSPLTLTVERGVVVSGRVLYSDGSPAPQVGINLRSDSQVNAFQQTDASGSFEFTNSPRGKVTLRIQTAWRDEPGDIAKDVTAPAADVVLTMPPSGRVTGRVVDAASSAPIAGFQISCSPSASQGERAMNMMRVSGTCRPTSFNSNDGSFVLEHVPAGKIDVIASADGYVRGTANAEVADGKTTDNVEIRLDPGARLTGRVTSSDGAPVAGAFVTAGESNARPRAMMDNATTDSNGDYKLTSVPPGEGRVTFSKQGFVRLEKTFQAEPSKETRIDAVLDRGLELRGRVIDESGQGVPNANVRAQAQGDGGNDRTDGAGNFTISGLRDRHFTVIASRGGYADARIDDVVPASSGPVVLTLKRGATVTGHVSGMPTDAMNVNVTVSGANVYRSGRVDAGGAFTVTAVPDGNFTAEAVAMSGPGGSVRRTPRVAVSVTNGTASPVELTFSEGMTVSGRVTINGTPASGARVVFNPMMPLAPNANSGVNADGSYTVSGVTPGDYRVSVFMPTAGSIYSDKYTVSGSGIYDIDIRGASLSGRVTDATSGAPVSDAQVSAFNLDSKPIGARPQITDAAGAYAFDQVVEGKWRVTVQRSGYRTESREVTVVGPATLDVQLSQAAKTTLALVDASDGRPVTGYVNVLDASKKTAGSGQSHADGTVDLWLAPGTYTLMAAASQYYSDPVTITAPVTGLRIPMQRAGRVIVRWPPGREVAFVRLALASPAMMIRSQVGTFDSVRPGAWTAALIGADNKPFAQQPVTVVAGQTATVVFP